MFKYILVAFDNSTYSNKALEKAMAMAADNKAAVDLVTVVQLPDYAGSIDEVDEIIQEGKKFFLGAHERVSAEAQKRGVQLTTKMLYGHIGETLVKYAAESGAELIVMGSHGRSAMGRLLLGSVSDYVVKHAKCPVMIVRE